MMGTSKQVPPNQVSTAGPHQETLAETMEAVLEACYEYGYMSMACMCYETDIVHVHHY